MAAAVLGRLPGTTVYRNVKQYPNSYIYHGMIILRIDSPIYFGNINFIKERLRAFELRTEVSANRGYDTGRIHFLIIEMSRMFLLPDFVSSEGHPLLQDLFLVKDICI
jgi:sulfate transporter 4